MIDHMGFAVSDVSKSQNFYDNALAPLGIKRMVSVDGPDGKPVRAGYGDGKSAYFWIVAGTPLIGNLHIAFSSPSFELVDQFYADAIASGGRDNGAPGLRPQYHDGYYAAFVLDPDGLNIEAVYHGAQTLTEV